MQPKMTRTVDERRQYCALDIDSWACRNDALTDLLTLADRVEALEAALRNVVEAEAAEEAAVMNTLDWHKAYANARAAHAAAAALLGEGEG